MPGKSCAAMVAIILLISILESLSQESRINRTCSISGWNFFFFKFNVIGNSGLCSKHFKVPYFKRPIYMPGFLSGFNNMERYWRRRTNFRRSCGKSTRIKWKLSEECRKQQVNHLKTDRKKNEN